MSIELWLHWWEKWCAPTLSQGVWVCHDAQIAWITPHAELQNFLFIHCSEWKYILRSLSSRAHMSTDYSVRSNDVIRAPQTHGYQLVLCSCVTTKQGLLVVGGKLSKGESTISWTEQAHLQRFRCDTKLLLFSGTPSPMSLWRSSISLSDCIPFSVDRWLTATNLQTVLLTRFATEQQKTNRRRSSPPSPQFGDLHLALLHAGKWMILGFPCVRLECCLQWEPETRDR